VCTLSPTRHGRTNGEIDGTAPGLQALAKSQSLRVAIKVRGKILFINLGDVISVQAEGNYVSWSCPKSRGVQKTSRGLRLTPAQ